MRRIAWLLVVAAACGRLGFRARSGTGDAAVDAADGPADAALGPICGSDGDCKPCQACDAGHCQAEPIDQLVLGHRTTCFLGSDGSRWCAGEEPGLGPGTTALFPTRFPGEDGWTSLSLGWQKNFGVRDGATWTWQTTDVPVAYAAATWPTIAIELQSVCFLDAAGSVTCDGTTVAGTWLAIDAGDNSYCGIQRDHTLWCWGTDKSHMLGQGSASADGTVYSQPMQVGTSAKWMDVSIGSQLACARQVNDTVWCWGSPADTGTDGVDTQGTPVQISNRTDWTWLAVRWQHACGGLPGGQVMCWGTDDYGLEVLPGATSVSVPTAMAQTWDDLRMGGHHYCGQTQGRWYCWGWNAAGQLGVGDTVTRQTPSVPLCTPAT